MFRNERVLYKRNCDLCGKQIITVFSPDKPYKVYCQPCWWSDNWDATEYAAEYDPKRNFFEQYKEFQAKVPYMALINGYTTLINSEYVNHTGHLKNCYLIFNSDYCENVYYGAMVNSDKDSMDLFGVDESELCYEDIRLLKCFRTFFSQDSRNCTNVYFSKALTGCSNCFGCINLHNKNYYIFNKPYSREEYEREIKKFRLDSFSAIEYIKKQTAEFWLKHPHRFARSAQNVNVSGDYIYECKNAHNMYMTRGVEDGRFSQWITLPPAKDIYDLTEWGNGIERVCDSITVGEGANNIKFCFGAWSSCSNIEYSMFAVNCENVFGCLNLKKKRYCIFNKQYSKEEYERIRREIISNMNENPYTDKTGRVYKYGEFFPYDLSLFSYNESTAAQYYPLAKEKIIEKGWRWHDSTRNEYKITMSAQEMPDSIEDVQETILKEILGCGNCGKAFRMVTGEYELLKRFGFPLPRLCPDCRHIGRIKKTNPYKLWDRKCAKCGTDIKTSYSPDRPEIVYCESCYNSEVA
ncbi:MAG: hypothetical protein HY432_03565 [Candidatus Liptonbacteria bacterium]|nr:hypothetical protein [Candidatus Liptonbacteria bacterium]